MSGIRVHFPTAQLIEAITAVASAIEQERHKTLEIMGTQLLSFAQLDYVTKSNGGTGTDGIHWAPIKAATLAARTKKGKGKKPRKAANNKFAGKHQIGVNTGLQRASASPGYKGSDGKGGNVTTFTETSVTVGYGRSYSEHFDKRRKLMPEQIPDQWMDELEELAAKHNAQVVIDTLSQFGVS